MEESSNLAEVEWGGVVIACSVCGDDEVLPYTDAYRESVSILPIDGWTSPPLRCPKCSPHNDEGQA